MEEIHYAYWLNSINGIGPVTIKRLLEKYGNYSNIWHLSAGDLADPTLMIQPSKQTMIIKSKNEEKVLESFYKISNQGIIFLHNTHSLFPEKLKSIPDAPTALYFKGKLPNPDKTSVAVIGARMCSEYGRYVARKICSALGSAGIQVISGLAKGIDQISQSSALNAGGYSLGVLGCGIDICYPEENISTYNQLIASGGLISEYPPGTKPKSSFFPRRNRIISGLSDAVIVIEAREHSGSLITADFALEQGKDVYALPGRVTDSLSHGCNRLIRQGAGIILSPEEFIQDLAVNYSLSGACSNASNQMSNLSKTLTFAQTLNLTDGEQKIMSVLGFDPLSINAIQDGTGLQYNELMNAIYKLTMQGLILQLGSHYIKNTV